MLLAKLFAIKWTLSNLAERSCGIRQRVGNSLGSLLLRPPTGIFMSSRQPSHLHLGTVTANYSCGEQPCIKKRSRRTHGKQSKIIFILKVISKRNLPLAFYLFQAPSPHRFLSWGGQAIRVCKRFAVYRLQHSHLPHQRTIILYMKCRSSRCLVYS
jgi:hypothetical protein